MDATTAISQTKQNFRHLGIALPDALTAAVEQIEKDIAPAKLHRNPGALVAAVADCLAAGKDPATDKRVQAELAREQLHQLNIPGSLGALGADRRATALTEHAPAVIEAMRPVVEEANGHLTALREQAPHVRDLTSADVVNGLKPAQLALWGYARESLAKLQRVEQVWTLLAAATRLATVTPDKRPLILADLTAAQLERLGRQARATDVVTAGHSLSLATFDTFTTRATTVQGDQAEALERQQAEGAEAFSKGWRRMHGTGAVA